MDCLSSEPKKSKKKCCKKSRKKCNTFRLYPFECFSCACNISKASNIHGLLSAQHNCCIHFLHINWHHKPNHKHHCTFPMPIRQIHMRLKSRQMMKLPGQSLSTVRLWSHFDPSVKMRLNLFFRKNHKKSG